MKITQDDVWGKYDEDLNLLSRGMIIAQGFIGEKYATMPLEEWKKLVQVSNICPIWGDELPYKSCTVICSKEQQDEVKYWLEYVHGGDSISRRKDLPDGKVALRSDYQCW